MYVNKKYFGEKSMSEINFVDLNNNEIRVCGDLFKPVKNVKINNLQKAQNKIEKMNKDNERVQDRIDKIKEIMDKPETSLEEYDELAKQLEEEEAKLDNDVLMESTAQIVLEFFDDITVEEYLDNAEPQDMATLGVMIPAIQCIKIGKNAKYINNLFIKAISANIDNYMDNILNPN